MPQLPARPRRRLLLAAAAAVVAPTTWAASAVVGSGRRHSESRAVGPFEAIALSGSIDLELAQAAQEALTLEGDDNVLPLVEAVVEPGRHGPTLQIRFKPGRSVSLRTPVKARVDVVRLKALASAGSGNLQVGTLRTPTLTLSLAGSSDAKLDDLQADSLQVSIAGSGQLQAKGQAQRASLSISGSGQVDLAPLATDDMTVRIAGSGDAKVTANQSLTVSIAGSGDVVWGGQATQVKSSVAGSGRVTRR